MRIKEMRERKGLTQTELARATGITQPSVSDFENGNKLPSVITLQKIATALNCTVDELLKDDER